jgi:hypothetical protein
MSYNPRRRASSGFKAKLAKGKEKARQLLDKRQAAATAASSKLHPNTNTAHPPSSADAPTALATALATAASPSVVVEDDNDAEDLDIGPIRPLGEPGDTVSSSDDDIHGRAAAASAAASGGGSGSVGGSGIEGVDVDGGGGLEAAPAYGGVRDNINVYDGGDDVSLTPLDSSRQATADSATTILAQPPVQNDDTGKGADYSGTRNSGDAVLEKASPGPGHGAPREDTAYDAGLPFDGRGGVNVFNAGSDHVPLQPRQYAAEYAFQQQEQQQEWQQQARRGQQPEEGTVSSPFAAPPSHPQQQQPQPQSAAQPQSPSLPSKSPAPPAQFPGHAKQSAHEQSPQAELNLDDVDALIRDVHNGLRGSNRGDGEEGGEITGELPSSGSLLYEEGRETPGGGYGGIVGGGGGGGGGLGQYDAMPPQSATPGFSNSSSSSSSSTVTADDLFAREFGQSGGYTATTAHRNEYEENDEEDTTPLMSTFYGEVEGDDDYDGELDGDDGGEGEDGGWGAPGGASRGASRGANVGEAARGGFQSDQASLSPGNRTPGPPLRHQFRGQANDTPLLSPSPLSPAADAAADGSAAGGGAGDAMTMKSTAKSGSAYEVGMGSTGNGGDSGEEGRAAINTVALSATPAAAVAGLKKRLIRKSTMGGSRTRRKPPAEQKERGGQGQGQGQPVQPERWGQAAANAVPDAVRDNMYRKWHGEMHRRLASSTKQIADAERTIRKCKVRAKTLEVETEDHQNLREERDEIQMTVGGARIAAERASTSLGASEDNLRAAQQMELARVREETHSTVSSRSVARYVEEIDQNVEDIRASLAADEKKVEAKVRSTETRRGELEGGMGRLKPGLRDVHARLAMIEADVAGKREARVSYFADNVEETERSRGLQTSELERATAVLKSDKGALEKLVGEVTAMRGQVADAAAAQMEADHGLRAIAEEIGAFEMQSAERCADDEAAAEAWVATMKPAEEELREVQGELATLRRAVAEGEEEHEEIVVEHRREVEENGESSTVLEERLGKIAELKELREAIARESEATLTVAETGHGGAQNVEQVHIVEARLVEKEEEALVHAWNLQDDALGMGSDELKSEITKLEQQKRSLEGVLVRADMENGSVRQAEVEAEVFHCRSEIEIKRQQLARLQRRRQDLHDERTVVEDLIGEWREASEATLGKAQRSAQDAATQMRALRHNRDDAAVALELIRTGGMGGKALSSTTAALMAVAVGGEAKVGDGSPSSTHALLRLGDRGRGQWVRKGVEGSSPPPPPPPPPPSGRHLRNPGSPLNHERRHVVLGSISSLESILRTSLDDRTAARGFAARSEIARLEAYHTLREASLVRIDVLVRREGELVEILETSSEAERERRQQTRVARDRDDEETNRRCLTTARRELEAMEVEGGAQAAMLLDGAGGEEKDALVGTRFAKPSPVRRGSAVAGARRGSVGNGRGGGGAAGASASAEAAHASRARRSHMLKQARERQIIEHGERRGRAMLLYRRRRSMGVDHGSLEGALKTMLASLRDQHRVAQTHQRRKDEAEEQLRELVRRLESDTEALKREEEKWDLVLERERGTLAAQHPSQQQYRVLEEEFTTLVEEVSRLEGGLQKSRAHCEEELKGLVQTREDMMAQCGSLADREKADRADARRHIAELVNESKDSRAALVQAEAALGRVEHALRDQEELLLAVSTARDTAIQDNRRKRAQAVASAKAAKAELERTEERLRRGEAEHRQDVHGVDGGDGSMGMMDDGDAGGYSSSSLSPDRGVGDSQQQQQQQQTQQRSPADSARSSALSTLSTESGLGGAEAAVFYQSPATHAAVRLPKKDLGLYTAAESRRLWWQVNFLLIGGVLKKATRTTAGSGGSGGNGGGRWGVTQRHFSLSADFKRLEWRKETKQKPEGFIVIDHVHAVEKVRRAGGPFMTPTITVGADGMADDDDMDDLASGGGGGGGGARGGEGEAATGPAGAGGGFGFHLLLSNGGSGGGRFDMLALDERDYDVWCMALDVLAYQTQQKGGRQRLRLLMKRVKTHDGIPEYMSQPGSTP